MISFVVFLLLFLFCFIYENQQIGSLCIFKWLTQRPLRSTQTGGINLCVFIVFVFITIAFNFVCFYWLVFGMKICFSYYSNCLRLVRVVVGTLPPAKLAVFEFEYLFVVACGRRNTFGCLGLKFQGQLRVIIFTFIFTVMLHLHRFSFICLRKL